MAGRDRVEHDQEDVGRARRRQRPRVSRDRLIRSLTQGDAARHEQNPNATGKLNLNDPPEPRRFDSRTGTIRAAIPSVTASQASV